MYVPISRLSCLASSAITAPPFTKNELICIRSIFDLFRCSTLLASASPQHRSLAPTDSHINLFFVFPGSKIRQAKH